MYLQKMIVLQKGTHARGRALSFKKDRTVAGPNCYIFGNISKINNFSYETLIDVSKIEDCLRFKMLLEIEANSCFAIFG